MFFDKIIFYFIEKEKEWQGPFFFVQGADCQPGLTYRWTGTYRMACTPDMPMKYFQISVLIIGFLY